ncbi:MAG: SDR family oxidoreductase, partial [Erysipelotrichaceae bacterium]|nr:SDR family oxidoreductase [Erysipelotrichaceae bacterium]
AGIVPAGTVLDFSEKDFDKAFDVNVKSVFFLSKMFLEHMLENGRGNIVNIASIAGLIGPKNRALYSASKGAVISLTRAMAMDHADTGVRINCICPGMVYSPSLEKRIEATDDPEETYRIFRNIIPMKRIGTVEEIAQAVLFVTGDENSFMTGSIINVDGGAGL